MRRCLLFLLFSVASHSRRYCRGVNAIVYVVDSADADAMDVARHELIDLISKPALAGIPLLVLGNKNDIDGAANVEELITKLQLKDIQGREVCCYSVSAKNQVCLHVVPVVEIGASITPPLCGVWFCAELLPFAGEHRHHVGVANQARQVEEVSKGPRVATLCINLSLANHQMRKVHFEPAASERKFPATFRT